MNLLSGYLVVLSFELTPFFWGAKRVRRGYTSIGCIPSICQLVKKAGPKIIADDYNYALAA